jgi:hypothetical protein
MPLKFHREEDLDTTMGRPEAGPASSVSTLHTLHAHPLADLRAATDIRHWQRSKHRIVHGVVRHVHHGHRGVIEGVAPRVQTLVGVRIKVVPAVISG